MDETMLQPIKLFLVLIAVDDLTFEETGADCNTAVKVTQLVSDLSDQAALRALFVRFAAATTRWRVLLVIGISTPRFRPL